MDYKDLTFVLDENLSSDYSIYHYLPGYISTVKDWDRLISSEYEDCNTFLLFSSTSDWFKYRDKAIKKLECFAKSLRWAVIPDSEKRGISGYFEKGYTEQDLMKLLDNAFEVPVKRQKPILTTVEDGKVVILEDKKGKALDMITASDLQDLEIPPLEFVVENFLPLGLMLLGAPPKSYKSYMCLDMALSICQGLDFLGFKTQKHGVLYLDLESTKRRPKTRIEQILKGKKAPNNLYIATESEILGKGFEEQIESAIKEHPDIKVVIVDVFKKIRPAGTKNKDGYDRDYEDYGRVKSVSDKLGIVIVLVTHTTKMKCENDPFNELTGSSGTMGSIDVAMVIKKEKRDDETAKLYITGRDLQQQCYEMKFNQENFRWQMLGEHRDVEKLRKELEYKTSPIIKTIKKLIEQNNGKWTGTVSDIINASKYFDGCCIFDKPQQVGQKITAYEDLLHNMDCIDIHRISDGGKNRLLNFVSSNPFIDNLL